MKERPIIFSAPMVRAILAGAKTQTRRVARFIPYRDGSNLRFSGLEAGYYCTGVPISGWVLRSRDGRGCWNDRTKPLHCPYGAAGDRLWVRESFCSVPSDGFDSIVPSEPEVQAGRQELAYKATESDILYGPWRPSIHMPRWASRILLEVIEVRVEKVRDISEDDARAEGAVPLHFTGTVNGEPGRGIVLDPLKAFAMLWDSINAERGLGWELNPWVWALTFRRINTDGSAFSSSDEAAKLEPAHA